MQAHVRKVCQTSYFHLRNITSIRESLTQGAAEKLVHAFISSRLDSCNSLLINIPSHLLSKLQRIQNAAARAILRKSKRQASSADLLQKLHWLPVKERIDFKVACLIFKCLNETAPLYLCELVSPYIPSRNLRSQQSGLLCQPSVNLQTYGQRSFHFYAPSLWNSFPQHLRNAAFTSSYPVFKSLLKTHLFKTAFSLP